MFKKYYKRYRRWTTEDIEQALKLISEGNSLKAVAIMMKISYSRLNDKMRRIINESSYTYR